MKVSRRLSRGRIVKALLTKKLARAGRDAVDSGEESQASSKVSRGLSRGGIVKALLAGMPSTAERSGRDAVKGLLQIVKGRNRQGPLDEEAR